MHNSIVDFVPMTLALIATMISNTWEMVTVFDSSLETAKYGWFFMLSLGMALNIGTVSFDYHVSESVKIKILRLIIYESKKFS